MLRLTPALALLVALLGCGSDAERTLPLATQGLYTGALSEDANFAVIGSLNHGASLWRTGTHERLYSWNHEAGGYSTLVATAFSPDARLAATADPRTLVIWDTATGEDRAFWGLPSAVRDLALANDGRRVLLGLEDHSAVLFDASTGTHLQTLLHQGVVSVVAMAADAQLGITGSDDETVTLWDLSTGQARFSLPLGNPIRCLALSGDGSRFFAASTRQPAGIHASDDGRVLHQLYERNPGITSARFSADGSLLLVGIVSGETDLFRVDNGQRLARWRLRSTGSLTGSGKAVLSLAFSPTQARYFALTSDGELNTLRLN